MFATISKRFCPSCNKTTKFEYNKVIGHSRCAICGYHGIGVIKPSNMKVKK